MKILHVCLANFYVDGYAYQENILPKINKEDGHEVLIIASTETFVDNMRIGYTEPGCYKTEDGIPIERLPYKKILTDFITHKLRFYDDLYTKIEIFNPDVIMCHDLSFGSVLDVIRYKKKNANVKLYADTHTASYNSGLNWISLHILHRIYYKYLVKKTIPYLEKYFYIGESERIFAAKNYYVPDCKMEFFPLGGIILNPDEYECIREKRRKELGVNDSERLYMHAGKIGYQKRTEELIRAFSSVDDDSCKLIIIGSIPEEQKKTLIPLIEQDKRIAFLGWKSSEDLQEYLCACDMYCQPGSPSATLQNAICNRCAILAYPHLPYTTRLDWGNFIWVESEQDIAEAFEHIAKNPDILLLLQKNSEKCANELLDYHKLASKLY